MNSINIMGRIVNEPELKFTKNQKAVTSIRVAVDSGYAAEDGSRQAYFFDVVAWEGTAQFITTWFAKGQMIAISGKLTTRSWTDKHDQKRVSVEIVAQNVYFCGERKQETRTSTAAELPTYQPTYQTSTGERPDFSYNNDFKPLGDDDNVPF